MTDSSGNIDGKNVGEAWSQLFLQSMRPGSKTLGPTMVRIRNTETEGMFGADPSLQQEIDTLLKTRKNPTVRETAGIIFPYTMWKVHQWGIDELTAWYLRDFMPRIRAVAKSHLRQTYFERMVNYSDEIAEKRSEGNNQLKFLIEACKGADHKLHHFRQSGLQVSFFDPKRDHTRSAQKNFPCLQQAGFYFCSDGSLGLSAYYPTQLIVERAYGNYLGLCQLGVFMAAQLGIPFQEFVCFIGSPRIGDEFTKDALKRLEQAARKCVEEASAE